MRIWWGHSVFTMGRDDAKSFTSWPTEGCFNLLVDNIDAHICYSVIMHDCAHVVADTFHCLGAIRLNAHFSLGQGKPKLGGHGKGHHTDIGSSISKHLDWRLLEHDSDFAGFDFVISLKMSNTFCLFAEVMLPDSSDELDSVAESSLSWMQWVAEERLEDFDFGMLWHPWNGHGHHRQNIPACMQHMLIHLCSD